MFPLKKAGISIEMQKTQLSLRTRLERASPQGSPQIAPNDWQLCHRLPDWIWLRQRAHKHFKKGLTRSLPAVLCTFVWNGAANYRVQQTQGVWGKVTGPTDGTKVVAGGTKQAAEWTNRENKGRAVFHLSGSSVYHSDANIICLSDASKKTRQKRCWGGARPEKMSYDGR